MPSRQHRGTPKRPRRPSKLKAAGLGIELLGAILGFTLVGLWIDSHYDTSPWGLLICIGLGFIGGFYNLIRQSLRALNSSSSSSTPSGSSPEKKRAPRDHADE